MLIFNDREKTFVMIILAESFPYENVHLNED